MAGKEAPFTLLHSILTLPLGSIEPVAHYYDHTSASCKEDCAWHTPSLAFTNSVSTDPSCLVELTALYHNGLSRRNNPHLTTPEVGNELLTPIPEDVIDRLSLNIANTGIRCCTCRQLMAFLAICVGTYTLRASRGHPHGRPTYSSAKSLARLGAVDSHTCPWCSGS